MRHNVFVQLDPGAIPPRVGHPGDAGYDLHTLESITLDPGESQDIRTGVRVQLPEGIWGRITGRSSSLRKHGLFVNEGVIDQGFRGELFVFVTNRNPMSFQVQAGERLAQLILSPVIEAAFTRVDKLDPSARGEQGFGSTGRGIETPSTAALNDWLVDKAIDDAQEAMAAYLARSAIPQAIIERWEQPETKPRIYLGGPIDMSIGDPDDRHRILARLMPGYRIDCPYCEQQSVRREHQDLINRNLEMIDAADWGVFVWGPGPSFGVPLEIVRMAERVPRRVVVVGALTGVYASVLRTAGVAIVPDLESAADHITVRREQPAGR